MVLDVVGQAFAAVKAFLDAGVGDVAGHDDRAVEQQARGDGVLRQVGENFLHRAVQVDGDAAGFTRLAEFFGDQAGGIVVELFNPDAFFVDLALDVAVGGAGDAHADRAGGAVARQADDADVVGHVLAAELGAEADLPGFFEELLFELDVAEGAGGFVAGGGQTVIVVAGGELHREHRAFGGGAADHEGDVVRRAGGRAEALHLFDEVGNELGRVEDGLRFLIEVGLVGGTAALDHAEELVLGAFGGFDVDLGGKVALRVHFLVHRERSVLGLAEGFLGVGLVDALGNGFFIAVAGPDLLALFAVNDGRARVLAEREDALGGGFGVAEEHQGDVLVVGRGFRVGEDLGNLFVVFATEHEVHVVEGAVDQLGEAFGFDLEDLLAFEFTDADVVLRQKIVFGLVFAGLEHGRIFKCGSLSHDVFALFSK